MNTLSDCRKKASSQRDLQVCADHEFTVVEPAMTRTYQRLLAKAKCDPVAEGGSEPPSNRGWHSEMRSLRRHIRIKTTG